MLSIWNGILFHDTTSVGAEFDHFMRSSMKFHFLEFCWRVTETKIVLCVNVGGDWSVSNNFFHDVILIWFDFPFLEIEVIRFSDSSKRWALLISSTCTISWEVESVWSTFVVDESSLLKEEST